MWDAGWYVGFDGLNRDALIDGLLEILIGTLLADVVKK
jgi:hypothetical protein